MSKLDAINKATRIFISKNRNKLVDSIFMEDPLIAWANRYKVAPEDESDPFLDYAQEVIRMNELEESVQSS